MNIPPYARYGKAKKVLDGRWVTGSVWGDIVNESNWLQDEEGMTFLIDQSTFVSLEDEK